MWYSQWDTSRSLLVISSKVLLSKTLLLFLVRSSFLLPGRGHKFWNYKSHLVLMQEGPGELTLKSHLYLRGWYNIFNQCLVAFTLTFSQTQSWTANVVDEKRHWLGQFTSHTNPVSNYFGKRSAVCRWAQASKDPPLLLGPIPLNPVAYSDMGEKCWLEKEREVWVWSRQVTCPLHAYCGNAIKRCY